MTGRRPVEARWGVRTLGRLETAGRLSLAANRTVTIRVKLSRSALKALRRRSVIATFRATMRNPGAASVSARKAVRLLRR